MEMSFFKKVKRYKLLLFMLLPAITFFIVFNYIPMAGVVIAFERFDYRGGVFGSPWVGFDNFKFLFISGDIFRVARNTALYNVAFIIINNTFEILIAIILSELGGKYFKKITQSIMFLPYFISWVVVGAFVYNIFNNEFGFMNTALKTLNMPSVNVYDKPLAWVAIIIFFALWKSVGYGTVFYLAAITGIDRGMYEAAEIDGANIFKRIFYITLPCLIPTIVILVLLALGNVFKGDFSMFYQIVGDNSLVYNATDVIDTYVIRSMTTIREFGMTSAAGLFQSVLGFVIINIANGAVKKIDSDYALF